MVDILGMDLLLYTISSEGADIWEIPETLAERKNAEATSAAFCCETLSANAVHAHNSNAIAADITFFIGFRLNF